MKTIERNSDSELKVTTPTFNVRIYSQKEIASMRESLDRRQEDIDRDRAFLGELENQFANLAVGQTVDILEELPEIKDKTNE